MPNCHACSQPLDGATVDCTFHGFSSSALNGLTFTCHARCIRLVIPEREISLAPIEEPDLVSVRQVFGEWLADCAEHGVVGEKDSEDDAHLAAAHHLARQHIGVLA